MCGCGCDRRVSPAVVIFVATGLSCLKCAAPETRSCHVRLAVSTLLCHGVRVLAQPQMPRFVLHCFCHWRRLSIAVFRLLLLLLLLLLTRRINALLSGRACERTCQQPTHHKRISCNMKKAFRFVAFRHCWIAHSSTNKIQLYPSLASIICPCYIPRGLRATDQCNSTPCKVPALGAHENSMGQRWSAINHCAFRQGAADSGRLRCGVVFPNMANKLVTFWTNCTCTPVFLVARVLVAIAVILVCRWFCLLP